MTTTGSHKRVKTDNRQSGICPRDTLRANRDSLLHCLAQLDADLQVAPEIRLEDPDPLLEEQRKDFALAQQIERHLQSIDQALQAADRGEYGICERCNQPIPPERLLALPEARLCVQCKSIEEKAVRRGAVTLH